MFRRLLVATVGTIITLLMIAPSYAFRDRIVAAWTMDEGSGNEIRDVSGNGNNGELASGIEWVDGKFGKALNFDGSSGYVEVPFSESLRLMNRGDFTVAAWIKATEVSNQYRVVLQQMNNNGAGRTWLEVNNNEIKSSLGGVNTLSGIQMEAEKWYHIAVVVTEEDDKDTIQMYVDGVPAGDPSTKGMEDSEGNFLIGRFKGQGGFWFGIVDEMVLIKKALSEDELADLMTNGVVNVKAVRSAGKLSVIWGSVKGFERP